MFVDVINAASWGTEIEDDVAARKSSVIEKAPTAFGSSHETYTAILVFWCAAVALLHFVAGRLGPGKDQARAQRSGEQQRCLVPGPGSRLIQEVRIRRRLAVHPEHHDERV